MADIVKNSQAYRMSAFENSPNPLFIFQLRSFHRRTRVNNEANKFLSIRDVSIKW